MTVRTYAPRGDSATSSYRHYQLTITNQYVLVDRPDGTHVAAVASLSGARRIVQHDRRNRRALHV